MWEGERMGRYLKNGVLEEFLKKKMEKRNKFGIKNLQTNIIIHIVRQ